MTLTVKIKGNAGLVIDEMREEFEPAMARAVFSAAKFAGGTLNEVAWRTFPSGTGELGRSFQAGVTFIASGKNVSAGALSNLPHADILDRGGTINPRTAKMLAIPLSREAKKLWPRDWPRGALAPIKTRAGNLLLIDAKSKSFIAHYVLKKSVTIKGRGYIEQARQEAEDDVAAIVAEEMGATFDAVPGVDKG